MFIQTASTPNPNTLKFLPEQEVLESSTAQFNNKDEAKNSPLAQVLFSIDGVESIFLSTDFISVTKTDTANWDTLKTEILTTIMEHFVAGKATINKAKVATQKAESAEEDSDIVKQIKELIETRVRPAVAQDGGDIIFHSFEEGIVKLELHGACSGCPSSTITLKNGIENMLKHYVPEVEAVEQVEA